MLDHQSMCPSYWLKSGCVTWSLCFISLPALQTLYVMFQTKKCLAALHLPKSCIEAITHVLQIITYAAVEKGMEHKGEQMWTSIGTDAVGEKAHLRAKKRQTVQKSSPYVSLSVIELCLSEGISK